MFSTELNNQTMNESLLHLFFIYLDRFSKHSYKETVHFIRDRAFLQIVDISTNNLGICIAPYIHVDVI